MPEEYFTTKACKLPDYLELVDFHRKPDYEQIKYLLFFVTEIAGLRKDMTAKVITQRLYNQGLRMNQAAVSEILETRKRFFSKSPHPYNPETDNDRAPDELAYIINPEESVRLVREANIKWQNFKWWMRKDSKFFSFITTCLLVLLVYVYVTESITGGVDDISWKEYRAKLQMATIPEPERALYMLYFITEHIKFREDMTPQVISDRLQETGLGTIKSEEIQSYFQSNPDKVSPSNTRAGAYKVTAREANDINERLGLKAPEDFSISWLVRNVGLQQAVAFFAFLAWVPVATWWIGRHTARSSSDSSSV